MTLVALVLVVLLALGEAGVIALQRRALRRQQSALARASDRMIEIAREQVDVDRLAELSPAARRRLGR